jgi:hypothetical protein
VKKESNKNDQVLKKRNEILRNGKKSKLEEKAKKLTFFSKINELRETLS